MGCLLLETRAGTRYWVLPNPDYRYVDQTGKYPASEDGKMEVLCLGEDGLYRCRGKKRMLREYIDEMQQKGKEVLYPGSIDQVFEADEISLVSAKETDQ